MHGKMRWPRHPQDVNENPQMAELPQSGTRRYQPGQHNVQRWGLDIHHPVFPASALLALVFVAGVLAAPGPARETFDALKQWTIARFDLLYMLNGNFFVLFCLAVAFSPAGRIRLGGTDARPEFSRSSWFAMLFAAGMGIGLMYWGVAEPVAYYTGWSGTPLGVEARTPAAAEFAMSATLFHWGLHPWAIYAVVGLALAFVSFNRGLPLTIRSAFHPLIGDRVWGPWGHLIDVVAVLFGLATSLGLGAMQAAAGVAYLADIEASFGLQLTIIVVVSALAGVSVVRGLDRGIRILSNINMLVAMALLGFVFIAGPTAAILETLGSTLMAYARDIVPLGSIGERPDQDWMRGWTIFYWAWWTAWAPFVGMFIARISRGRSVREFVVAVLLVPALVTLLWMSTFGGAALDQVQSGAGPLAAGIDKVDLALFQMLGQLPLAAISSAVAIALVLIFFMTSSDSGSLVIDTITAGGKSDAPVVQRIFWAGLQGAVAAVLLFGGGADALTALQAMTIAVGVPFSLLILAMCLSLGMGLREELRRQR
jgi:BCCT family betaine/carnitine transporter